MAAPKLDISLSPQRHFFIEEDLYENNLKRKSIFFVVNFLNKPLFEVGRSTINFHDGFE